MANNDDDLNLLYSPSMWNKRMSADLIVDNHGLVMAEKSELARKAVPFKTLRFDDGQETFLQIFARQGFLQKMNEASSIDSLDFAGQPIFVYIHGGYWQWGTVYASSYMAENFTKKGITVVALGYDIAPSCSMEKLVSQARTAMGGILKAAKKSCSKVYVCGHSAGAHLAAMMLHADFQDASDALVGLILVSGLFDLTPLVSTDVNVNLKMDLAAAKRLSPQLLSDLKITKHLSVLMAYAENDSPAFKEQSCNYEKLLKEKTSFAVKNICIPTVDHFNVAENLSSDAYLLTKEVYKMIANDE